MADMYAQTATLCFCVHAAIHSLFLMSPFTTRFSISTFVPTNLGLNASTKTHICIQFHIKLKIIDLSTCKTIIT